MLIGAHQSTAGGYSEAVKRVQSIGGNCLQLFSTSPRGWKPASLKPGEREKFAFVRSQYGISPIYFHASYLINLAGSERVQVKSIDSLIAELNTAKKFGIRGSVVHLGSFGSGRIFEEKDYSPLNEEYKTLCDNIQMILKNTPDDTLFIIENMGVRKIGLTIEEIGFIIKQVSDPRLRVCLDTCHLHAAGYDISTKKALDSFLGSCDDAFGLDRLEVIHVNDSRDPFGSLRDRHENIGEGFIEKQSFTTLVNHSQLSHLPFILETPGFDGNGPDMKNVQIVKTYRR